LQKLAPKAAVKTELLPTNPKINDVIVSVKSGKYTVEALRAWYTISAETEKFINDQL
jgi:hypothetical protein